MPGESIAGMENHFLFLGNVAAHWVALMSGIAALAMAIVEAFRKHRLSERIFWIVGALFFVVAVDLAWQDEHRNTQVVIAQKASAESVKNSCEYNWRIQEAYAKGLEGSNRQQQQNIEEQRNFTEKQQTAINNCVVSLGKMNPRVRELISVVPIPMYTTEPNSNRLVDRFSLRPKAYVSGLIITTNEIQNRFHGNIRCENPFTPLGAPQMPASSQTVFTANAPPSSISDREYEISVTMSGSEWGPNSPVYMIVSSLKDTVGKCMFTPR
jgi:hypothetical protein